MIARVLVALDGSPASPHVLASALEVAVPAMASVRLFRAVAIPPEFPAAARASQHDRLEDVMLAEARGQMAALAEAARQLTEVTWDVEVVAGSSPKLAILEAAERFGADLIVMGSHGYTMLDAVLGTTASSVANHARCNVLVVRPEPAPR